VLFCGFEFTGEVEHSKPGTIVNVDRTDLTRILYHFSDERVSTFEKNDFPLANDSYIVIADSGAKYVIRNKDAHSPVADGRFYLPGD
jgi:hypothetical protein